MKKILITGAAGFIGSHLVELLLEKNIPSNNLRLLILKNESLDNLPKADFDIIRGDITNEQDLKKAVKDVDIVYHLAALTIEGGKYYLKEEYERVNVEGTKKLLEECKDENIKKFVFFSSIAVYGLPAWIGNINGWNETQEKDPREIYGESKLLAESALVEAHEKWNIPYVIIRPTSVYGPRDKRNLLELFKTIKKHIFFYIGDGKNKMDYVFVKDVALGAYLAAASNKTHDDYIIGAGKPITLNEIGLVVSESINSKVIPIHIPKIVGFFISYLVLWISNLLKIKPLFFPNRVRVMTRNCYYDITKAEKELKYKPLFSFEEGTKLTAKWLVENKLI